MDTKKKLEKKISAFFNENAKEVLQKMNIFQEAEHYTAVVDLGKKFLFVCEQILDDPRFAYMKKLHSAVKQIKLLIGDRINQIENLENIHVSDNENQEFINEEFIEHFKPIYTRFYKNVDHIHHELLEEVKEKPDNEFEHYWKKSRFLMKSRVIRDFTPEQEELIENLKQNLSQSEINDFMKQLSDRQEAKLWDDYRVANEYYIVGIEDKGWFNTVRLYSRKWIQYLKRMRKFHQHHNNDHIVEKIQKEINKINNYIIKIEKKYSKSIKLNVKQTSLLNKSIKKVIFSYKHDRKALREYNRDLAILNHIRNLT